MDDHDKKLILDFALKRISEEVFLSRYSGQIQDRTRHIEDILRGSLASKNAEEVEFSILLLFVLRVYDTDLVEILNQLLLEDWHFKHEDIVSIFEVLKSPDSVESLYQITQKELPYLAYDDLFSLARRVTWALSKINTQESLEKLRLLSQSENIIIQQYAQERLEEKQIQ